MLLKLIEDSISPGTYPYVVTTGGSSERRPELHSEGAFLYHNNPGRHPQVLLGCQRHPGGEWLLTDGNNQFNPPGHLGFFWFWFLPFHDGSCFLTALNTHVHLRKRELGLHNSLRSGPVKQFAHL